MCVIIVKKPTDILTAEDFELFADSNKDGWGFCYNDPQGVPQSFRGMTLPELNAVAGAMDGREAVLHFRLSTHGKTNVENCHPFEVLPGLYLLHNGIFSIECNLDKEMSDTWHFGELLVKPLVMYVPEEDRPAYIRTPAFRHALEEVAGYNKVVLFDREGSVIYNRKAWVERAGPKELLMSNSGPYWHVRTSSRVTKDYDNFDTGDADFFPQWAARDGISTKSDTAIIVYDKNGAEKAGGESAIYGAVVEEIEDDIDDEEDLYLHFLEETAYDDLCDPTWLSQPGITDSYIELFVSYYPREATECLMRLLPERDELVDSEELIEAF